MDEHPWLNEAETAVARVLEEKDLGQRAARALHLLENQPHGTELSLDEAAVLLRADLDEGLLSRRAREARERSFGRRVALFAPLYYSNVCANDCLYCGFRSSLGTSDRRVLSAAEVADEADALVKQGHRRILLIASEDPTPKGLQLALAAVQAVGQVAPIRRGVSGSTGNGVRLAIELAPRSPGDFARLSAAGVSGYVLFQETYDRRLYPEVHPSGPKTNFTRRVRGPEAAAAGGIEEIGIGALYGLGEPLRETIALLAHARDLEQRLGRPVASVSVPRLEPAEGAPLAERPPRPVGDSQWLRIVAVLRLALPRTHIIVSTREPVSIRRVSLGAGATVFSAGSRTDPGGYRSPGGSRSQFRVGDDRPFAEVADDLRSLGYEPVTELDPPGIRVR